MKKNPSQKIDLQIKAGVVVRHRGKVLLIRELNNNTGTYAWNIIKGTFEPGKDADISKMALREAREEANIKIKLRYVLGTYYLLDGNRSRVLFVFIADLLGGRIVISNKNQQKKYGEDIIETGFFTREELKKMKLKDFHGRRAYLAVQDYLKGKRFSLDILTTLNKK